MEKEAKEERKALTPAEVEERAMEQFFERARVFLANDPYWMHVLTMEGGRAKRRQVAKSFATMMCFIPKVPGSVFNREVRREFNREMRRGS